MYVKAQIYRYGIYAQSVFDIQFAYSFISDIMVPPPKKRRESELNIL